MLRKILIVAVLGLAAFAGVAAMQPSDFRVVRTTTVEAPPAAVFEQINHLQNWNAWSPWAKLDPNARQVFEGPTAGVGSSFAWAGNNEVGEGKMTITESTPNERVVLRLEFVKPFAATNTTEFTMRPEGTGTAVTWSMAGKNNFVGKCVGLVMDCEKMVGGQFEQGFANLKAVLAPNAKS